MEQMNGKELAEQVAYSINFFGFDNKAFCKQMHTEHRTLQQNFMRLIRTYIEETARMEKWEFDDRNEASVMMCRKLVEIMENDEGKDFCLPYI